LEISHEYQGSGRAGLGLGTAWRWAHQVWGLSAVVGEAKDVRFWRIVLKNSKFAGLRKSRKCSALPISAAARLCRIDTRASDRFCDN